MIKRNRAKVKYLMITLIIVVIVVLIVGKKKNWFGKSVGVEIEEVVSAADKTIMEIISANGKIQPVTEVKISPDVSGEIVELNVIEGQSVSKGDLLIKIKPDVYESIKERTEAALNSSKAQKEQILVQLEQARLSYERNVKLFESKAITEADYETSLSNYENLKAQLKMSDFNIASAEATLKESIENLQKTTIYAPINGVVSLLNVELGERVVGTAQMAGTELLRIADLAEMEAKTEVNENDIVRVSVGDTATVEIDAYPGNKFKGVVTRIANTAIVKTSVDQVTNFEVRVFILPDSYRDLVNQKNSSPLRPGMSASVDIVTDRREVLSVPIQSVTMRDINGESTEVVFVYVADSSKVYQRTVKSGIQDFRDIEIKEGISKEDKVVSAPYSAISKSLSDGKLVYVKKETK